MYAAIRCTLCANSNNQSSGLRITKAGETKTRFTHTYNMYAFAQYSMTKHCVHLAKIR